MLIIGVNKVYHDSACCAVAEGNVVAAVEEERFSGRRHDKAFCPSDVGLFPLRSLNYCLAACNCSFPEVDHIAFSFQPTRRLLRWMYAAWRAKVEPTKYFRELTAWANNRYPLAFLRANSSYDAGLKERLVLVKVRRPQVHRVAHHLAHAASAYFCSGFENAAICTVDGIGEWTCTFLGHGTDQKIGCTKEFFFPNSIGFFYEGITRFLGFEVNRDEHKVTALASLGRPRYYDALRLLVPLLPGGAYQVAIDFWQQSVLAPAELIRALGPPRLKGSAINERHADVAASAQAVLEDTLLHILRELKRATATTRLCLAGGVFLNCQLNERIRSDAGFDEVFVQPAANDAGTALGAALWTHNVTLGLPRSSPLMSVYLGPEVSEQEIEHSLVAGGLIHWRSADVAADCAKLIAGGNVVGWFQGRAEWGPRALGNRSILADPRDPEMKRKINRLKSRYEFQPVAPAVLVESVSELLADDAPSPYMMFARSVRPEVRARIPAAVHVDGTARVQTVDRIQNPLFHRLIGEFSGLTGVPAVVNTSLNRKGKPMVCSVSQAIDCFFNSGLDYLALGPFLVSKSERASDAARASAAGKGVAV